MWIAVQRCMARASLLRRAKPRSWARRRWEGEALQSGPTDALHTGGGAGKERPEWPGPLGRSGVAEARAATCCEVGRRREGVGNEFANKFGNEFCNKFGNEFGNAFGSELGNEFGNAFGSELGGGRRARAAGIYSELVQGVNDSFTPSNQQPMPGAASRWRGEGGGRRARAAGKERRRGGKGGDLLRLAANLRSTCEPRCDLRPTCGQLAVTCGQLAANLRPAMRLAANLRSTCGQLASTVQRCRPTPRTRYEPAALLERSGLATTPLDPADDPTDALHTSGVVGPERGRTSETHYTTCPLVALQPAHTPNP